MARVHNECPVCHKNVGVKSELRLPKLIIYTFTCKHTWTEKILVETDEEVKAEPIVTPPAPAPTVLFCPVCKSDKRVISAHGDAINGSDTLECDHILTRGVFKLTQEEIDARKPKVKTPYHITVEDFGIRPGKRFGSNHKVACENHKHYLENGFCPKWDWFDENGPCKFIGIPERYDIRWLDLFQFQREGVAFIEKANFRALVGDDPGLGKSVQAAYTVRTHRDILTPTLIVCPPGLIYNWQRFMKNWYCDKYRTHEDVPFITFGGIMVPGQRIYIVSNMLIQREEVQAEIKEMKFQCIIIDESHSFMNDSANRTTALMGLVQSIPYRICLSGTSIVNRIRDYFNTLNMIAPHHWPNMGYLNAFCDRDEKGKIVCISNTRRNEFFRRVDQYVIRRHKADVLTQLPPKSINYAPLNIADNKSFVKEYNKVTDELEDVLNKRRGDLSNSGMFMQILKLITKLRELVGLAKIKHIAAYAEEFLENTEPEDKLCIGAHHVEVRRLLGLMLEKWNPIMGGSEPALVKEQKINEFRKPERRLAIISILAYGEGRDIQFCPNAIQAEREWNPAKERQFHDRFHRIGSEKYTTHVNIDIPLAKDTIDEFFDALVRAKGEMGKSALDKDYATDSEFIIQLAELAVQKRLKYVG